MVYSSSNQFIVGSSFKYAHGISHRDIQYGFRIGRTRRQPGLYYMRNTSAAYFAEHENAVVESVLDMLEEL